MATTRLGYAWRRDAAIRATRFKAGLFCAAAGLLASGGLALYAENADSPSSASVSLDRTESATPTRRDPLAREFSREIWPMLTRGKTSCVSCHDGSNGADLEFLRRPDENFTMLLREDAFSLSDPSALIAKLTAPNDKTRMPPPPAPRWSQTDLDRLQKFCAAVARLTSDASPDGAPADERFPTELLAPYTGPAPAGGFDNTFITYTQLKGKVATIFGDDWHRNGKDLFKQHIEAFGGADFGQRFNESSRPTAAFLTALERMARDVASRAYLQRSGPFANWPEAFPAPLGHDAAPPAYRRAIDQLFERILFRPPASREVELAFDLFQAAYRSTDAADTEGYALSFAVEVRDASGLVSHREFGLDVSAEGLGMYQEPIDQSIDADDKLARHTLNRRFTFIVGGSPAQRLRISNDGTHGNVSLHGIELRGPGDVETTIRIAVEDPGVELYGAWQRRERGGVVSYEDGDNDKGNSSIVIPIRVDDVGEYAITVVWRANDDNAARVPVEVFSYDADRLTPVPPEPLPPPGEARFHVDQTVDTEPFTDLGTAFRFTSPDHYVEINNAGTRKLVTADAVKFTPLAGGESVVVDNPQAENNDTWVAFKARSFRAYNRVGKDSVSDQGKEKGELWIRYRLPGDSDSTEPAALYRVAVGFPAKRDHETRTPVVVKADRSTPIVRLRYPAHANVGAEIVFDASGSYTVQRSELAYAWRQLSGPRVALPETSGARVRFVASRRDPEQVAWERVAATLVQHADFLFTRPPSLAAATDPAQRRRLQLVKIALDLLGRAPTRDELRVVDDGTPVEEMVRRFLQTEDFRDFYFHRIRLYLESHGDALQDEPTRLWCYIAFNDRPITEILDADYTVNTAFERESRPAHHGRTGLLTMPGFIEGKPGLPHFNYAAQVAEMFLGYVFEVPPEIVESREGITAAGTTDPASVCYSCHKILTPLAYQRLAWDDNGQYRSADESGQPIDDSDQGLVPSYPFKGKGMEAFAQAAKRKEQFIRTIVNTHFVFYFGRPMRHTTDERGLYKRVWDALEANDYTIRSVIRTLLASPEYLNGGAASTTVAATP